MNFVNHADFVAKYGQFPDFLLDQVRTSVRSKFTHAYEIGDVIHFISISLFVDLLSNIKSEARAKIINDMAECLRAVVKEMENRSIDVTVDPTK